MNARVFITGSADGLGKAAAETLLREGHRVVVHVRGPHRREAVRDLVARGADVVEGDLAEISQIRAVATQVNDLGTMDAVIHNAGVYSGPSVLIVNVIAPYLLTALMARPKRLVYLSSGMHRSGRPDLATLQDADALEGGKPGKRGARASYADSKLFVTAFAAAIARRWTDVLSHAVDPGWVPTRMGGPGAPDDLRLGHLTQEWLATSDDVEARTSGGYWHHQRRVEPHRAVHDRGFQDALCEALARTTGTPLL